MPTSSPKRPQNGKEGTPNESSIFWIGKGPPSPRPREAGETSKASKSLVGGRVASERPRDTKRTRRVPKGWRKGSQEGAASEKGSQEGAKKEVRDHEGSAVDSNEALLVPQAPPLAPSWLPFFARGGFLGPFSLSLLPFCPPVASRWPPSHL